MAMYAVHAHVGRAKPHRPDRVVLSSAVVRDSELVAIERVELAGRSLSDRIDERLSRVRDAWSQSIFFVFDPDSWR